jgi:signal transduction histidine kinase
MRVFKSKEGFVSFSITNEGLIEKQVLKKIFHPRIKGKSSNGSGIGLHYAKKLVLRLGGNIEVSQVGEQVLVCLTLPLYKKGNS